MNTENKPPQEAMPENTPVDKAADTPVAASADAPVAKPVASSESVVGEASADAGQTPEAQTPMATTAETTEAEVKPESESVEPSAVQPVQQAQQPAQQTDDGAAKAESQDSEPDKAGESAESLDTAEKPAEQSAETTGAANVADVASAPDVADVKDTKDETKTAAEAKAEKRGGGPRRVSGVVVSDKADKTARVRIERRVKHALYGKIIRRRTHLQAHDADNQCRIGDVVTLEESPRFSKTKSWRVISVIPGDGR